MIINPSQAAAIYQTNAGKVEKATRVIQNADPTQVNDREQVKSDFLNTIRSYTQNVIQTNAKAERVATDSITGEANVTEVITAVASAEASLQTLVTVRDKVIAAYQEILRMPI
jgi:flagellar hook-basal body complex protein FliE